GFNPGPYSDGGAGNEDGFGSFNQTINSFDGFDHSSTTISFTLTNTSGTWGSAADVLAANASGNVVAAPIFVCVDSPGCTQSSSKPATGFATQSGPTSTPEPSSTVLLSLALISVGFGARKFAQARG